MTMPDERMRAVGWGGELLEQIASDTALPDTMIAAAKRIALTYPTLHTLEGQLRSGAAGLPPEWATALLEALELFDEMRASAIGSARTRSDLRYALRHFPDKMTIRAMLRTSRLDEWLQQTEERRVKQSGQPGASPYISLAETHALLADSLAARHARLDSDEMSTTDQAAELLETTRVTIDSWINEGRAIGLRDGEGGFKLPKWQFEKPVWDLLPALSRSLQTTEGWALLSFLETPQGAFDRASPLLMIERGHAPRVLELAAEVDPVRLPRMSDEP